MTDTSSLPYKVRTAAAVEAAIQIALALLLVASCSLILRPFAVIIAWGIILAVAAYPWFRNSRPCSAGVLDWRLRFSLSYFLHSFTIPTILLGESLVEGIQSVAAKFKDGSQLIPRHR